MLQRVDFDPPRKLLDREAQMAHDPEGESW